MGKKKSKIRGYEAEYVIIDYETCEVLHTGYFTKHPSSVNKAPLKDYSLTLIFEHGLEVGKYIVQLGKKDEEQIASFFIKNGIFDEENMYVAIEWMPSRRDYPSRITYGAKYTTPNEEVWRPVQSTFKKRGTKIAKNGTVICRGETHDFRSEKNGYIGHEVEKYMDRNGILSIDDLNDIDYKLIMIETNKY